MQIFYYSKPMYTHNSDFINIDTDIIKLVEHQHYTWSKENLLTTIDLNLITVFFTV